MATAVQTSTAPKTPNPRLKLAAASAAGAVVVIAAVALAGSVIPAYWAEAVSPTFAGYRITDLMLRVAAQMAALVGVVWLGTRVLGMSPPKGLRGGIFLAVSVLVSLFFVVRAVGIHTGDLSYGQYITLAALVAGLVAGYQFLTSAKAEKWAVALENHGWFHTFSYKRTQGLRARRYTLVGILVVGLSGVWALWGSHQLDGKSWQLTLPYLDKTVTVLTDLEYTVPVLLVALTFWVGWRAVNIPTFADFLVATEAEMNKVSWSSRKRLTQDTIVVLTTTVLLTGFLLLVDVFWGWLLSREFVQVLPPRTNAPAGEVDPTHGNKVEY